MIEEENEEIRQTTSYKRIKAYLLEHYDKDDIVLYDSQGRYVIFETVRKNYSINEALREGIYHSICQLAMDDLVKDGIYSKLGDQYVRVIENTTKSEKSKPKDNKRKGKTRIRRTPKEYREQLKAARIEAGIGTRPRGRNIQNRTEGKRQQGIIDDGYEQK